MGNLNVNISVEAVVVQNEQETVVKKQPNIFDVKHYLQARLAPNEKTKTLTIRLLPFSPDGGSPFQKVYMHQVKVPKEVSTSGWKSFVCPIHNKMGDACPFCTTADEARKLKNETDDKIKKESLGNVEYLNRVKEMWIVRCIERGHEEDGVKFWLFSHSKKNDGVYNKIMNIFSRRLDAAKANNKISNIFDLNEGKDLSITLTKDSNNKNVINVIDDDDKTPLSTDFDLAVSWINDTKKWSDVYTLKNYDYMSIIVGGGIPVYDKVLMKYIDKDEAKEEAETAKNADIANNLTVSQVDYSTASATDSLKGVITSVEVEEDLPF